MKVLIQIRLLESQAALRSDVQSPFYRRAGLVLPVGFASVHDVTQAQLAVLSADPRLDVEPFSDDASGFPRPLAAGTVLGAAELEERRRRRA